LSGKGLLSVGELAAFLTYITKLLFATLGMGGQLMTLSRAKASADRINEVLDTPRIERTAGYCRAIRNRMPKTTSAAG
ncbi:hypothetical protein, partial [Paenibacillus riograndensis]